jgi:cold shock CspA family protein/ribosome-associated translation inhibitor RaiA
METPLQITFRNMAPSESIEKRIGKKVEKLKLLYNRLLSCRVLIEAPHRHHYKGRCYTVRIDLMVPGGELVIRKTPNRLETKKFSRSKELATELRERHEPSKQAAREDLYVAIRDAFNAAGRKLQDYARRRSLAIKLHEPRPHGRVITLFPEERYGFLKTPDDREIYFHGSSVLDPGFERLDIGMKVYFAEEKGEKGSQASTVRFARRHGTYRGTRGIR